MENKEKQVKTSTQLKDIVMDEVRFVTFVVTAILMQTIISHNQHPLMSTHIIISLLTGSCIYALLIYEQIAILTEVG